MASVESAIADLSIKDADSRQALADASGDQNTANIKDVDAAAKALAHGWTEPEKYDYDAYNMSNPAGLTGTAGAGTANGTNDMNGHKSTDDLTQTTQEVPSWAANAEKYEWKDEYGDVGPPFPELEKMLFHNDNINRVGLKFDQLNAINVTVESEAKISPIFQFADAGLHPVMRQNIELCGYKMPTPIQAYCLPAILKNHDVIAVAQTGSGKTAAFLVPTLSKLMGKAKKLAAPRPNLTQAYDPMVHGVRAEPLLLVVAPTRELSTQIFDEARRLCYRSMLRPCVVYGGAPVREQADELRKGCDILIATPGRLLDFMAKPYLLSLSRVKYTIIDEADEMVGPDWLEEMKAITEGKDKKIDDDHCFMMFSATFPKEARVVAKEYMADDHIRIRVGRTGSTHQNILQNVIFVEEAKKRSALFDLLMSVPPSRTIVFVNNKKAADFLDDFLYNKGLPSTSIHSDRTQREREDALRAFKLGKAPILVATGVSARGIDVKNVMHVVNYDLPNTAYGGVHEYVHRIGRTARIGNEGTATSFYNERNEDIAEALVKVLVESNQTVPDFLEAYKPAEGADLDFGDDTDNEGEGDAEGGASAWGAATTEEAPGGWDASAPADTEEAAGGWGASTPAVPAATAPPPADSWGAPATSPAEMAW